MTPYARLGSQVRISGQRLLMARLTDNERCWEKRLVDEALKHGRDA